MYKLVSGSDRAGIRASLASIIVRVTVRLGSGSVRGRIRVGFIKSFVHRSFVVCIVYRKVVVVWGKFIMQVIDRMIGLLCSSTVCKEGAMPSNTSHCCDISGLVLVGEVVFLEMMVFFIL